MRTAVVALATLGVMSFALGGCKERPTGAASTTGAAAASRDASEATGRRQATVARLRTEGVPINPHLPRVETTSEVRLRGTREIVERVAALLAVCERGLGSSADKVRSILRLPAVHELMSPDERAFFEAESPSDRDKVQFSWRAEAAVALLWSVSLEPAPLGRPEQPCDVAAMVKLFKEKTVEELVGAARLRPAAEILDKLDEVYCYHWAVRDEMLRNRDVPAGLHPGIVMEWHYALNWLTYYAEEWDDVSTDT